MLNFAVIGFGYWGPNIVRNILQIGSNVKYIVDLMPQRREDARKMYPSSIVTDNYDAALNDRTVDAVVIVLPVSLHYPMAKKALEAGKHVLVEKPLADNSENTKELISLANSNGLTLMVDHTYLYSPHVEHIKQYFVSKREKLQYFDSIRINLGKFQRDVNVAWDLAVHDLSILNYLCNDTPKSVIATGCAHTSSGLEDIVYITLKYDKPFIAHITVSWISPQKVRKIIIGGTDSMVVFDDVDVDKIKVFDSHFKEDPEKKDVVCTSGSIGLPSVESKETLSIMLSDFVESVEKRRTPRSSAELGLGVVKILEAVQASLDAGGKEVNL